MRLENYIMEQDINTASVADIFVEQAQAELDVAMALLDSSIKDMTFQEFYIQEGELGTAVADARAEVRSDGKKHHIKAAFAAIKAFFKFMITKIGSFFKKSKVNGDAFTSKMAVAMKETSQVAGTSVDVKFPYTKEQFGKIYSYYESLDKKLEQLTDIATQLFDWFAQEQNTFNDTTKVKFEKEIKAFIDQANMIESISKPDSSFKNNVKKLSDEIRKKIANGGMVMAHDGYSQREAKAAYKAATKTPSDSDWVLDGDTWVFADKNADTIYIGWEDYLKFKECLNKAGSAWKTEQSKLASVIKDIDAMRGTTTDGEGNTYYGITGQAADNPRGGSRPKKGDYDKRTDYKAARDAYDSRTRVNNKDRILRSISTYLKDMEKAITKIISNADSINSTITRANVKKANASSFAGNIGAGKRFANAHEAAEWKRNHPNESLKDSEDGYNPLNSDGTPKKKSKYNDSNRKIENEKSDDEKRSAILDSIYNMVH